MTNPLLVNIKLPGRIFQLPSKGVFYKNNELSPDVKEGEVHVQAMSALDDITMKNPDQLFSGAAVNTVFKKCIEGVNLPGELMAKDIDALMIYLRVVTYGPNYDFIANHNCEGGKDHTYTANLDKLIEEMKTIDPTTISEMYKLVVPETGQTVILHPHKYQEVLTLIKKNQNKTDSTIEDSHENLVMMLLGVIESVENIKDRDQIREWITAIPPTVVNKIAKKVENIENWGPDLKWECTCKDCGENFTVDLPINPISFFTE